MRLLVPLDVHGCADAVTERALWLARLGGKDARVDLLTVASADGAGGVTTLDLGTRQVQLEAPLDEDTANLYRGLARLMEHNGVLGDVLARRGRPADVILQVCAERRPELIVMGSHARRGLKRAIFGSVAEEVLRKAGCGVLVEPAGRELDEHPSEARLQADAEHTG